MFSVWLLRYRPIVQFRQLLRTSTFDRRYEEAQIQKVRQNEIVEEETAKIEKRNDGRWRSGWGRHRLGRSVDDERRRRFRFETAQSGRWPVEARSQEASATQNAGSIGGTATENLAIDGQKGIG